MGRLMKRLEVKCRNCDHTHVPHRLTARYHSGDAATIKKRVQLWQCKKCGHFWQDSVFKKKRNLLLRMVSSGES
jgi:YgiT-type zinc finger domain-containing protein